MSITEIRYFAASRIYRPREQGGIWENDDGLAWAENARHGALLIAQGAIMAPDEHSHLRLWHAAYDDGDWVATPWQWVRPAIERKELFQARAGGARFAIEYDHVRRGWLVVTADCGGQHVSDPHVLAAAGRVVAQAPLH